MSLGTTSTPHANTSGQTSSTTSQAVHLVGLADLARPRVERQVRRVEHADAVPAEALAIGTRAFDELARPATSDATSRCSTSGRSTRAARVKRNARSRTCSAPRTSAWTYRSISSTVRAWRAAGIESLPAVRERAAPSASCSVKPSRVAKSPSACVGHRGRPADRRRRSTSDGVGNAAAPTGNAIELGANRCAGRRLPRALAAGERRNLGVLDHQMARQDERGDLGIAEPFEQAPDVAIDRLLPHASAAIEVAAHERAIDTRVDGRGVEGDQSAFGVADDADLRRRRRAGRGSGRPPRALSGPRSRSDGGPCGTPAGRSTRARSAGSAEAVRRRSGSARAGPASG